MWLECSFIWLISPGPTLEDCLVSSLTEPLAQRVSALPECELKVQLCWKASSHSHRHQQCEKNTGQAKDGVGYHSSFGTFRNSPTSVKPWANIASGRASSRMFSFISSYWPWYLGIWLPLPLNTTTMLFGNLITVLITRVSPLSNYIHVKTAGLIAHKPGAKILLKYRIYKNNARVVG